MNSTLAQQLILDLGVENQILYHNECHETSQFKMKTINTKMLTLRFCSCSEFNGKDKIPFFKCNTSSILVRSMQAFQIQFSRAVILANVILEIAQPPITCIVTIKLGLQVWNVGSEEPIQPYRICTVVAIPPITSENKKNTNHCLF